jgi:phosphopantetheine adenylyltransferase
MLNKYFNWHKPTVQMLGRYQPWHKGHTELFKRAHAKTGQVVIMVRRTGEGYHDTEDMKRQLKAEGFMDQVDYIAIEVPNVVNITYGRDVGYAIEKETLPENIESISATEIRNGKG